MYKTILFSLFTALLVATAPLSVSANYATDGVAGIPTFSQAFSFASSYFPSVTDYTIAHDPDGGYAILYDQTSYDPIAVAAALAVFTGSSAPVAIDLQAGVSPFAFDPVRGSLYDLTVTQFPISNYTEYQTYLTASLAVPVTVQFDYTRNGFDATTEDFSVSAVLTLTPDGVGVVTISNVSFADAGNWRYRMINDPGGLFEPLSSPTRANNTSTWENYVVVPPTSTATTTATTTPNPWPIISDFESYGAGYSDQSSGGTTCTSFRGWVCANPEGTQPLKIDVLVDGSVYDTIYTNGARTDVTNKFWPHPMPACPKVGENRYGFNYTTPAALKDGVTRTVRLRAERTDGTTAFIPNAIWSPGSVSTMPLSCAPVPTINPDLSAHVGTIPDQISGQPFVVPNTQVRNQSATSTGASYQVTLQFDHGTDGYDPTTVDFSVSKTMPVLAAGAQIDPNFTGVTNTVDGPWQVRMIVDQARAVEPDSGGQRGNNRSNWQPYTVVPPTAPLTSPLPNCTLTPFPTSVTAGNPVTLNWITTNAVSAEVVGQGPVDPTLGSTGLPVTPSAPSTTYVMEVTNAAGDTTTCSTPPVTVLSPMTLDLTVDVTSALTGFTNNFTAPGTANITSPADIVDITWTSTNADKCYKTFLPPTDTATVGSTNINPAGITPGSPGSYTVECENLAGDTITRSVGYNIPTFTIDLTVDDNVVEKGGTADFTYDVSIPTGTTYSVDCDLNGIAADSVTTSVSVGPVTVTSNPVNNMSVAVMTCTEPITGYTVTSDAIAVDVIPSFQEI